MLVVPMVAAAVATAAGPSAAADSIDLENKCLECAGIGIVPCEKPKLAIEKHEEAQQLLIGVMHGQQITLRWPACCSHLVCMVYSFVPSFCTP